MKPFGKLEHPLAITMWDFSWLERRWPGAGYEDWDRVLDELMERGYDAIRIDAYPHLTHIDPDGEWEIIPPWNQQVWGSPARIRVSQILPALLEFLTKCSERKLKVALSSWFQNDATEARKLISSPAAHARIWQKTLEAIHQAGLIDTVLYLDFCNEWPLKCWAPFFPFEKAEGWFSEESLEWMRGSVTELKRSFPELPMTYSLTAIPDRKVFTKIDTEFLDFLEPHQWMAGHTDFYDRVGYNYERFESKGYENVVKYAEGLYRNDEGYWKQKFAQRLDNLIDWSCTTKRSLVTTEGWSIVDYKDWPGLDWSWVKELNEWSVQYVAKSGCWAAICTSNFCGPQFHGMWRDVAWHQRVTNSIHQSKLPAYL